MVIDASDFAAAMARGDSNLRKVPFLGSVEAWLEEAQVPESLRALIAANSYSSFVEVGPVTFDCVNEVALRNQEPQNYSAYLSGLLIVGSGLNGDPVFVDLRSGETGFLRHDALWEAEVAPNVSELRHVVAQSIGRFYLGALVDESFPRDSYDAEERGLCA